MPLTPHTKDKNRKSQMDERARNPEKWGVGRNRGKEIEATSKGPSNPNKK